MTPSARWSVRLHLAVLRLLRPRLARDHGSEIAAALAELHDEARASGWGRCRLWWREAVSLVSSLRDARAGSRRRSTPGRPHSRTVRSPILSDLTLDTRCALRAMTASKGATATAIVALGLGIGTSTTVFSIADATLFKELPYEDPHELVEVFGPAGDGEYVDALQRSLRSIESISPFTIGSHELVGPQGSVLGRSLRVGRRFFTTLGVAARRGRVFGPDDYAPDAPPVAIVTDGLWRSLLGADPQAIGAAIRIDGVPHTLVGVMAPDWNFVRYSTRDLFVPLPTAEARRAMVIARLREGTSLHAANVEAEQVGASFGIEAEEGRRLLYMESLAEMVTSARRPQVALLAGAAGLVLLVACANVANLLLVRALSRRGEISVRLALGASRGRIVRQLFTESSLLAAAGGGLGLLLTARTLPTMVALNPGFFRAAAPTVVDHRALGFAVVASAATLLLSGLAPALLAGRSDLGRAAGSDPRLTESFRGRRLINLLVVGEIALSLALLVGTGLLVHTFLDLSVSSPGFDPAGKIVFEVRPTERRYPDGAALTRLYDQVLEALRELPGIDDAAAISAPPLSTFGQVSPARAIADGADPARSDLPSVRVERASANYHALMDIPILRGRALAENPTTALPELVISERVANEVYPGENPVGHVVTLQSFVDEATFVVVGVAADTRSSGRHTDPSATVWVRYRDRPDDRLTFLIQAHEPPADHMQAIRERVARIDPELPFWTMTTMDEVAYSSVSRARFFTWLMGLFGGTAIVLTTIGFYGVMEHSVARRTRELAIRLTLGATPAALRRMVLRQGAVLIGLGIVVGLAICVAAARLIESWLYGVSPTDPTIYALLVALVVAVGLAAAHFPAARATRVDPLGSLRSS